MTAWLEEKVYHDGDRFFADLNQAITDAVATLDLETYIFERDPLGQSILRALAEAAKRGVRVRLLLDGVGCSDWTHHEADEVRQSGVELRFYHPLPWQPSKFRFWHLLKVRKLILGLWKLNRRNHRKTCIIDGRTAFLGGMNVSSHHSRKESGRQVWRDTSARITGPEVIQLTYAFDRAWQHPRKLKLRWSSYRQIDIHATSIRLNVTFRQRRTAYRDLLQRILSSRTRVWITNPYFVPDVSLIRALRFAARTGIDVRMIFPRHTDVWVMKWAVRAFYHILLSGRVRVHEYESSVLHAKLVMIDDWATVGSTNLNHRSLLHDLEADVVLSKSESLQSLQQQFRQDLEQSTEVSLKSWKNRPWVQKLGERLILIFRRWL